MMDGSEFMFGTSAEDLGVRREVKVRVPVQYLIKLHGIKLLGGEGISETVAEALDEYFATLTARGLSPRDPA